MAHRDPALGLAYLFGGTIVGLGQIQDFGHAVCTAGAILASIAGGKVLNHFLTSTVPNNPSLSSGSSYNNGTSLALGTGNSLVPSNPSFGGGAITPIEGGLVTTGNYTGIDIPSGDSIIPCQNSFTADTEVSTPEGNIPISEIEIGDTVLAYNEETGATGEYTVTNTISHEDDWQLTLTVNGEEIETTPWHLFYTSEGWLEAQELEIGDSLLSLGGVYGTVENILIEEVSQTMYDLTVEEVHTFTVGEGTWVVHNNCYISTSQIQEATSLYDANILTTQEYNNLPSFEGECTMCATKEALNPQHHGRPRVVVYFRDMGHAVLAVAPNGIDIHNLDINDMIIVDNTVFGRSFGYRPGITLGVYSQGHIGEVYDGQSSAIAQIINSILGR